MQLLSRMCHVALPYHTLFYPPRSLLSAIAPLCPRTHTSASHSRPLKAFKPKARQVLDTHQQPRSLQAALFVWASQADSNMSDDSATCSCDHSSANKGASPARASGRWFLSKLAFGLSWTSHRCGFASGMFCSIALLPLLHCHSSSSARHVISSCRTAADSPGLNTAAGGGSRV